MYAVILSLLRPGGLSIERQQYLVSDFCPHVFPDCQNELCPHPNPADVDMPAAVDLDMPAADASVAATIAGDEHQLYRNASVIC